MGGSSTDWGTAERHLLLDESMIFALVALPWLVGFHADAVAERPTRAVAGELADWGAPDDECVASAYGGLALDRGTTRVIASFSQGVFVLGPDHQLIARAPGFDCTGSADELVALATGEAWVGTPLIALAATAGGRAESVTWLSLYRVSDGGVVEAVFTGAVERHANHETHTGTVTVIPGGLIYQPPEGRTSIWTYDGTRYVDQGDFPAA
jgi:hypothetical protein